MSAAAIKRAGVSLGLLVVLASLVARFVGLAASPPGFYADEAATAVDMRCLAETGADVHGRPWPLFFKEFPRAGTIYGAPLIYAGAAWTSVFGAGITSLRVLAALCISVTILAAVRLAHSAWGPVAAWAAALCFAVAPWAFHLSRILWDEPVTLMFLMTGTTLAWRLRRMPAAVLAGLLFAAAACSYQPARLQAPLLVLGLIGFGWRRGQRRSLLMIMAVSFGVASLPLAAGILTGDLQGRFAELSIFGSAAGAGGHGALASFLSNVAAELSPRFLWVDGDANLRNSAGLGVLSWLTAAALAAAAAATVRSPRRASAGAPRDLLWFCIYAAASGILPALLTRAGMPHALRASGAWPFVELLAAAALTLACRRWPLLLPAFAAAAALELGLLLHYYFAVYPERARSVFLADLNDEAAGVARSGGDWRSFIDRQDPQEVHLLYYPIAYGGLSCEASRRLLP